MSFAVYNDTLDRVESGPYERIEEAAMAMRRKRFEAGCKHAYTLLDTDTSMTLGTIFTVQ